MTKKVPELYVVDALSFGEAEEAITWLNMTAMYEKRDGIEKAQEAIDRCLTEAWKKLEEAEKTAEAGYYAFVCDKCAPTFGYYGWFAVKNELQKRAEEIYERLGAVTEES